MRSGSVREVSGAGKAMERSVLWGPYYLDFEVSVEGEEVSNRLYEGKREVGPVEWGTEDRWGKEPQTKKEALVRRLM
jgi:hypothetical protein